MFSKAHKAHIALSESMTSIIQLCSSLVTCPTSSPKLDYITELRVVELVPSPVMWEVATNKTGEVSVPQELLKVKYRFEAELILASAGTPAIDKHYIALDLWSSLSDNLASVPGLTFESISSKARQVHMSKLKTVRDALV